MACGCSGIARIKTFFIYIANCSLYWLLGIRSGALWYMGGTSLQVSMVIGMNVIRSCYKQLLRQYGSAAFTSSSVFRVPEDMVQTHYYRNWKRSKLFTDHNTTVYIQEKPSLGSMDCPRLTNKEPPSDQK